MPLLGDVASEHAETSKSRATRRVIHGLVNHDPTGRVAQSLARAITEGVTQKAIDTATDKAIVWMLEQMLGDAALVRANADYIKAAGSGYTWTG